MKRNQSILLINKMEFSGADARPGFGSVPVFPAGSAFFAVK
jgi:hypothetical protein